MAAAPQHFDIGAALPRHLQPQHFHDLEDKRDEIMQYLMTEEGMAGVEAQMYIQNLESDLMTTVGR